MDLSVNTNCMEKALSAWAATEAGLKSHLGDHTHRSWTARLVVLKADENTVTIGAPNDFARRRIEERFAPVIREFWAPHDNRVVQFDVGQEPAGEMIAAKAAASSRLDMDAPRQSATPEHRYSFENFVIGQSNELAYAISRRIAQGHGCQYNPVVIYGPHGMGKTHLLLAIKNHMAKEDSGRKVKYLTSEDFVSTFVRSLRTQGRDEVEAFKASLRDCDVLMIDDAHFIADKPSSQEELLHTLIALIGDGRQVVLATDRHPDVIPKASARLKSYMCGGLLCDINAADYELRRKILDRLVAREQTMGRDLSLPDDARDHLAARFNASPRELEGAFNQIMARAEFLGLPITLETVQNSLLESQNGRGQRATVENIQKAVAEYFSITLDELLSKSRKRIYSRPRQIAMYLCKTLTQRSLPDIGRRFSRDHTTVMHAEQKVLQLRETFEDIDRDVKVLEDKLRRGH